MKDPFPQTTGSQELELRLRLLFDAVQRIPRFKQRPDPTLQPLLWIEDSTGQLKYTADNVDTDAKWGGGGSGDGTGTLVIGTVTTLAAGAAATATITDGKLNLGIPVGFTGATGPEGPQGPPGPAGTGGGGTIDGGFAPDKTVMAFQVVDGGGASG